MRSIIIIYATVLSSVCTSYSPQQVMVDVTNDFGICVLQLVSSRRENVAFSPYGIVSVGLVLYEGANGPTAAEIHNTLRLPWDRHITRIGFRDIHRYLKSYFTNDGFLRGLVLSKPNVILHWNYTRQLQFYGFDLKPAETTTEIPSVAPSTPMEPNQTSNSKAPTTTEAITTTTVISTQHLSTIETTITENKQQETDEQTKTTPTTTSANTEIEDSKTTLSNPQTTNLGTTEIEKQPTSTSLPATFTPMLEPTKETTLMESEVTVGTTLPSSNPSTTAPNTEPITTISSQTTISPLTEPITTNIVSESSKTDTTTLLTTPNPQLEGREEENLVPEITTQTTESIVTVSTQSIEITRSTAIFTGSESLTSNLPEITSNTPQDSTKTEDNIKETTVTMAETVMSTTLSPNPTTTQPTIATPQETVTQGTIPDSISELTSFSETPTTIEETSMSGTTDATTGAPVVTAATTETLLTNEVTTQQTAVSETEELASEAETSRKKRAFYSKGDVPEHREGISNWVPHYQDPRWNYHAPLENWFFTNFGGVKAPIITYSAYLPFAYLADLSTLALQLPLDDPRYYMLILLPEDRNGLEKLLYSLQWCPIRGILDQLKITAVYATVPVFTIVKHVNLVPALAKLGILSIFDPSTADLSAMSSEKGLFVRTIEQVVTVSLRKYFANYRWFEAKPGEVEQHFIANHPFAYFVLDKETQVALMTGTIVNPIAYNQ